MENDLTLAAKLEASKISQLGKRIKFKQILLVMLNHKFQQEY